MKKVLFVINTMGYGGAERALIELLKRFNSNEYDVSLYVLLNQGELIEQIPEFVHVLNEEYYYESVLNKNGKKLLKHTLFKRLRRFSTLKNIPYIIRNLLKMNLKNIKLDKLLWKSIADTGMANIQHYDMAISYLEGGSAYYVDRHIAADHKYAFIHVDYKQAGYTRELDENCYLHFEKIFTVSDDVRQSFVDVYPELKNKTLVFNNLVDQKSIINKATVDIGFEDDFDGLRILSVGRLTSQKAYHLSISAMKIIKEQGYKARWYVLGDGELKDELQKQIDHLGLNDDFILLGVVSNPYPYFLNCDVYTHATMFEGKSIAIQEAQTLGAAIVVSNSSGNRDLVEDDYDGLICELTPESIAQKTIELLNDANKRALFGKRSASKIIKDDENLRILLDTEKRKTWSKVKYEHKDALIIIPAYNEKNNISKFFDQLEAHGINQIADILVVNDASNDGTNKIVKMRGYNLITNVFNSGYGGSLQVGYKYAVRKGYDYVVQMDADGQHDAANVKPILNKLKDKDKYGKYPDIVIGSRFIDGSGNYPMSFSKRIAVSLFKFLIKTFTHQEIKDPTSGLQGLSFETFLFYSKFGQYDDKYPDTNILIQMMMLGFKVEEIPAIMHERVEGVSMHSGLKPIIYMIRMSLSIIAAVIRVKIYGSDKKIVKELDDWKI